ncbi:MAG: hypothetical protein FJW39_14825 [Acidobacteria bacterium]|nr:hypothetical protein [Acidobacteriota bacterium]
MKTSAACALLTATAALAQSDLSGTMGLDLEDRLIRYSASGDLRDPVAVLQKKLDRGEAKLPWDTRLGYLPAVLQALGIPPASQVLVFSKTSFQLARIAPATPRAIYFNDDVYAGWVQDGDVMEFSSNDPLKGSIFYTLDQNPKRAPKFIRRDECLQCHSSPRTLGVPGHMVRSVYAGADGYPYFQAGGFSTDHRSPLKERWGGWYVTGTHANDVHMGNAFLKDKDKENPENMDLKAGANVMSLAGRFDHRRYLSGHSDIVALMVLEHQVRMHNLLTRVSYEARVALEQQASMNKALLRPEGEWSDSTRRRIRNPAEVLLQYMLFRDEAPLRGPVKGTSGFAADFAKSGPRDTRGRSLRELDLKTRMFRYPCSYLVYSPAFDELPREVKLHLYQRLWEVLNGRDTSKLYADMKAEDRRAVAEILMDTKPEIAEYFATR